MAPPRLLGSLLKGELENFLASNDVNFELTATKDALIPLVRATLEAASVNPDYYDFVSNRELQPVGTAHPSALPSRDLPPPSPFELEPSATAALRWDRWLKRFGIYALAIRLGEETFEVQRSVFLHVAGSDVLDLMSSSGERCSAQLTPACSRGLDEFLSSEAESALRASCVSESCSTT